MVPPPLVPIMMPGPVVTGINLPAIQPSVNVLSGNKPSLVVVKPEATAQSVVDDIETIRETRHKTHRVFSYGSHNNTKTNDKNRLEAHELPGFKRDESEEDVVVYAAKDGSLHEMPVGDVPKVSNSTETPIRHFEAPAAAPPTEPLPEDAKKSTEPLSEGSVASEQASVDLLTKVSMTLMNHLIDSFRGKEKQFLADKVSQKHQNHVAAVTVCKSAVRNGGDFASCMHSISSKQGEDFIDYTEHTIQARSYPESEVEFSLPLSPQFISAIDVFNRLPEVKLKHLEALSRMMEAEAELHGKDESDYWQWHDFREFSASFRQGVLKVIEFTRRHHRHRKSSITCEQLTAAFHEIFTMAEAIEDGIIYDSELVHFEPTKYLVKHPEIHELYQKALKRCVKKKELKHLMEASELESNVDLRIISDANQGSHWTEKDASLSFPRKGDRHRDQRNKRDEDDLEERDVSSPTTVGPEGIHGPISIHNLTALEAAAVILPREHNGFDYEHGVMHLQIGFGTLAALGSLVLIISIVCTWFKQYCTRRRQPAMPPQYGYLQDQRLALGNNEAEKQNYVQW